MAFKTKNKSVRLGWQKIRHYMTNVLKDVTQTATGVITKHMKNLQF